MGQITIRNVSDATVERLKRQAEQNGRSFEAELREILTREAKPTLSEMRMRFDRLQDEHFGARTLSDSSELLREDRDR